MKYYPTVFFGSKPSAQVASITCRKLLRSATLSRILIFFIFCIPFALAFSSYRLIFTRSISAFVLRGESLESYPATNESVFRWAGAATFEDRWNETVETYQVQQFRKNYLQNCIRYNGTYTIDIEDALSKARFRHLFTDHYVTRGLGSALNALLPAFVLSQVVDPPRRFHLIAEHWNYGNFSETFSDFSDSSPCQIIKLAPANPDRNVAVFLHSNGSVIIDKPDALFELNYVPHSREHDLVYWNLPLVIGWDRYFHVMSITARAFLTPHPSVLQIIRRIWTELGGSYVFVHIRRGDKALESEAVDITRYTEVLQAKCNGSTTVFVMSDGIGSHEEVSLALAGNYRIVSYKVLMERWGLQAAKEESAEHYQEKFDVLPEVQRRALAFELVASMYIGAMADFAVCTYSSNICRLIALFRGGEMNNNGVYSVDWPKWAVVVSNNLVNIPDT